MATAWVFVLDSRRGVAVTRGAGVPKSGMFRFIMTECDRFVAFVATSDATWTIGRPSKGGRQGSA